MLRRSGAPGGAVRRHAGRGPGGLRPLLGDISRSCVVLYEDNFNFLSKMCLGAMRRAACQMIGAARRAAPGSSSPAPMPPMRQSRTCGRRRRGACGEGLEALRQLVQRLDADPTLDSEQLAVRLTGIAAGTLPAVPSGVPRARRATWRSHPSRPAWDLIDMERYRRIWQARTATSASTWRPRAAARSAATGAPSRSGATAICSAHRRGRRGDAGSEAQFRARPHLVCGRHLRLPRRLGAGIRAGGARRRRARPVHHPDARRPDEADDGGGIARGRLPRGLAGRGKRQPAGARRHEQGHAGRGDPYARARG